MPGGNYTFECQVEVDSRLEMDVNVTWTLNGENLQSKTDSESDNYFIDANNTLYVYNATEDNVGEYICRVKTPVDEVMEAGGHKSNRGSC